VVLVVVCYQGSVSCGALRRPSVNLLRTYMVVK